MKFAKSSINRVYDVSILEIILAVIFVAFIHSAYVISLLVLFVSIFLFCINFRLAVKFYIFVVLVSSAVDITSYDEKIKLVTHSVYLDYIGGLGVYTLLTVFLAGVCLLYLLVLNRHLKISKSILFGILLPLSVPMYGIFINSFKAFFSDSGLFVGTFVGFMLAYIASMRLAEFIKLIMLAILSTAIFHVLLALSSGHLIYYGAIGNLYPILFLLWSNITVGIKCLYIPLAVANLIIFPGRSRIAGYVYSLFLLGVQNVTSIFAFIRVLLLYLLVTFVILALLSYMSEHTSNFLFWKLTSFTGSSEADISSYTRILELQNIIMLDLHNVVHFFIGGGYGSCFSDTYYPYPDYVLYGDSNYPPEQIASHCFVKPHLNISVLLLKAGMVLSVVFFIVLFYQIFIVLRRNIKAAILGEEWKILYFTPFWFLVAYNQQKFVIFGLFVYLLNQAILMSRSTVMRSETNIVAT